MKFYLFTLALYILTYDVTYRPVGSHSRSDKSGCSCFDIIVKSLVSTNINCPPDDALKDNIKE
jgi:hypothetical protein